MVINFFRIETEGLFRGLAEYHEKLEAQIPIIQQSEFEKVQEWSKNESVEYAEYDIAIDDLRWNYDYYFPRSLRYSFIVLLFLVVEKQLTEFCKTLQEEHNLSIKVGDLRGDISERAKIYIHKLGGIPDDKVNWKNVGDLSVVRNCIVHTMGDVNNSRDRIYIQNLISLNIGLSIGNEEFSERGKLQISAEYCTTAVQDIQFFFDELFDSAGMGEKWSRK
jgi:hypothetical protein